MNGFSRIHFGGKAQCMLRAAVSTLKATPGTYPTKIKAGDEVLVVERGKPIVKLLPLSSKGRQDETLRNLIRASLVRPGEGNATGRIWDITSPQRPAQSRT